MNELENLKKILAIKKVVDIPIDELIEGENYNPKDTIDGIKAILKSDGK